MPGTVKTRSEFQKHTPSIRNGAIEINLSMEERKYKNFFRTNGKMNWTINLKNSCGHSTTIVLLYDSNTNIGIKMGSGTELTETKIGNLMKMDQ